MTHIALIGAGMLGGRHLQALVQLDRPAQITVLEPVAANRERAHSWIQTMETQTEVVFTDQVSDLPKSLDVVVVATGADVRRPVVEALLEQSKIRHLILEKFLFQQLADYDAVADLFKTVDTHVWVNCARRAWPFYQSLKPQLAKVRQYIVRGKDWNLGSNAVHHLDLISWLADASVAAIDCRQLDPVVRDGKRPGTVEFTGLVRGALENGVTFEIGSYSDQETPMQAELHTEQGVWKLHEFDKQVVSPDGEAKPLDVPFQSNLTHHVVQDLLDQDSCPLTAYAESAALHQQLLQAFLKHMHAVTGDEVTRCPIT